MKNYARKELPLAGYLNFLYVTIGITKLPTAICNHWHSQVTYGCRGSFLCITETNICDQTYLGTNWKQVCSRQSLIPSLNLSANWWPTEKQHIWQLRGILVLVSSELTSLSNSLLFLKYISHHAVIIFTSFRSLQANIYFWQPASTYAHYRWPVSVLISAVVVTIRHWLWMEGNYLQ